MIFLNWTHQYLPSSFTVASGKFRSVGGSVSGHANSVGAAGTVYKYESRRGPQYRELKYNPDANLTSFKPEHAKVKVDNEDRNVATPTVIMENQTVFYEFDEMQIEGEICRKIINWLWGLQYIIIDGLKYQA